LRIRTLFKRREDPDFHPELQEHLRLLTERYVRQGLSPEDAASAARRQFGNTTLLQEQLHHMQGVPRLESLWRDCRFGCRALLRNPTFATTVVLTLALGIGATAAVFSVANTVLLRPFPYRDPSRLVMVWEDDTAYGFPRNNGGPFAFTEWRQRNHVFDDIAALTHDSLNLTGGGDPEYLRADTVTSNFFSLLGVDAPHGRTFRPDDGRPGAGLTVLLSHGLWIRRFAADPQIIGRDILLNDAKYTVIGVMPQGFQFLDPRIDVWVPAQWTPDFVQRRKTDHFLTMIARLKRRVNVDTANADMAALGRQLTADRIWYADAVVVPLREQVAGDVRPAILMLLGAVGFLLLIACANIASLQLARASARQREIAVRLTLGASRARVVQQMLTESVLLALISGAAGVAVASSGTKLLVLLVPRGIADSARVDWRLLAFTAAVSIATGILFGVLPAFRASRTGLIGPLKQGGTQGGSDGQATRQLLVVGEVALAIVLLAGAALMIRSLAKLLTQNPGFRPEHVLTLRTALPRPKYADAARRTEFYREVVQRVETRPGIVAAGYVTSLPLANSGGGSLVTVENRPVDPDHMLIANVRVVTPGYFRAVGMTLRRGRLLAQADGADAPGVVVANDAMARTYWPGEDPLGRRFKRGLPQSPGPWWTVVGIVDDMRQGGMGLPVRPEAYFPFEQADFFAPDSLAVRTLGDPLAVAEQVRREIWAVDKDQPVAAVMPLQQLVDDNVAPARLETTLLTGFSGVALLLASLGIYAVLSFAVARRTQEIGVRVALGARPGDVLRMVVAQGLGLLAAGASIGVAAAVALSRFVEHLLFGVRASDPLSYAVVVLLLAMVAAVAAYLPARRAMRVDPIVALRYE
jgi:predicted permease